MQSDDGRRGDTARSPAGARPGFRHDALVFGDLDQLTSIAAPWLLEGLSAGDAALVAAGPDVTGAFADALGDEPRVMVVERHALYRARTPTTITAFRRFAEEHAAPGHRVRVVGETDYGSTAADQREWQAYEAVVNRALARYPLWGLCVVDSALPEAVLDSVRQTHPQLVTAGGRAPNPGFMDPADYLRALPVPEEPLEATPPALADDALTGLAGLRAAVRELLAAVDGPAAVLEDFLMAVDEIASNAVRHGGLPAGLRLWTAPGRLVATIRDSGRGLRDPFAGYGPAHGEDLALGGMGLWLARQLCDHVAVRRSEDGVTVRLSTTWV